MLDEWCAGPHQTKRGPNNWCRVCQKNRCWMEKGSGVEVRVLPDSCSSNWLMYAHVSCSTHGWWRQGSLSLSNWSSVVCCSELFQKLWKQERHSIFSQEERKEREKEKKERNERKERKEEWNRKRVKEWVLLCPFGSAWISKRQDLLVFDKYKTVVKEGTPRAMQFLLLKCCWFRDYNILGYH